MLCPCITTAEQRNINKHLAVVFHQFRDAKGRGITVCLPPACLQGIGQAASPKHFAPSSCLTGQLAEGVFADTGQS